MKAGEIHTPDLGDFSDVLVIDVLVKVGDRIEVESPLITLETDKATMDVPSPRAGVISALHVAKGDRISTGTLLATIEEEKEGAEGEAKVKSAAADSGKPDSGKSG
ncbi:MAG: biotin/lipoyl-containing protein, partial [Candidatus Binatia bacterium]